MISRRCGRYIGVNNHVGDANNVGWGINPKLSPRRLALLVKMRELYLHQKQPVKVSNVENMISMFDHATSFNQPLNNWNVSKVTEMNNMFRGASVLRRSLRICISELFFQNISIFNVSVLESGRKFLFSAVRDGAVKLYIFRC